MVTDASDRHDQGYLGGQPQMNGMYDNSGLQEHIRLEFYNMLPYDDPAVINPDELATFPKQVKEDPYHHSDHESHLVSKRSPLRNGRNITRTDYSPNENGYI